MGSTKLAISHYIEKKVENSGKCRISKAQPNPAPKVKLEHETFAGKTVAQGPAFCNKSSCLNRKI